MRILRRCLAAVATLAVVGVTSPSASAQSDPPVETSTTIAASSSSAPASSTTSTTLPPCEATADVAVSFVGNPKVRSGTLITFTVKSVVTGAIPGDTINVDFPRDERFLFDQDTYLVAASFDVEAKSYVSKIRPLPDTPERCFLVDPVVTKHADGSEIDTGVFAGMSGNWSKIPLAFVIPLGAVVGGLAVIVLLRRSAWMIGRRTIGRWIESRRSVSSS